LVISTNRTSGIAARGIARGITGAVAGAITVAGGGGLQPAGIRARRRR